MLCCPLTFALCIFFSLPCWLANIFSAFWSFLANVLFWNSCNVFRLVWSLMWALSWLSSTCRVFSCSSNTNLTTATFVCCNLIGEFCQFLTVVRFIGINDTHASRPLLLSYLLYDPRVLLDILTLIDGARLAAAAMGGARAVSAVEGEGPIVWESIVLVGWPTRSLM